MKQITLTIPECISLALGSFIVGIIIFAYVFAFVFIPAQSAQRKIDLQLAYDKGAMVKISESKSKCREWQITDRGVHCL